MKNTIMVKMTEENGRKVERRIDISAFFVPNGGVSKLEKDELKQRNILNDWIAERGNPQHSTFLTLDSWEII